MLKEKKKSMPIKKKTMAISLAVLVTGYTAGRVQEANDRWMYKQISKAQIVHAAMEGYSFSEDVDHEFYRYNTVLYRDTSSMKIMGLEVKDNGKVVAPRWKNGEVSVPIKDKFARSIESKINDLQTYIEECYEEFKDSSAAVKFRELSNRVKDYFIP